MTRKTTISFTFVYTQFKITCRKGKKARDAECEIAYFPSNVQDHCLKRREWEILKYNRTLSAKHGQSKYFNHTNTRAHYEG